MALWVFVVLVIPNFSPFLAAYLRPIPTVYEVHENMRRLSGDIRQQSREEIEAFIQERGGELTALSDAEKRTIDENRAKTDEPKRGKSSRNPTRFHQPS